jgi:hypothetical protein
MTITITKATVGGSEDQWGTITNTALDDLVDVLNGVTASTPDLTAGSWKVGGVVISATGAEINYIDGVTSNIQTQIDGKLTGSNVAATVTTLTSTTVNATTIDLGDWTITQSGGDLKFAYQGTDRLKLASDGSLTAEGDIETSGSA